VDRRAYTLPGRGPLAGIAAADALLGRPFPLPTVPLPLTRWTEVRRCRSAQESLRPVTELLWEADGLHLRITAQGPWERETLVMLAASVK